MKNKGIWNATLDGKPIRSVEFRGNEGEVMLQFNKWAMRMLERSGRLRHRRVLESLTVAYDAGQPLECFDLDGVYGYAPLDASVPVEEVPVDTNTYFCNHCEVVYDPRGQDSSCPHCGGTDISEANACQWCGDYDKLREVSKNDIVENICSVCYISTYLDLNEWAEGNVHEYEW